MATNKIVNSPKKTKNQPNKSAKSIEMRPKSVKSVKTDKFTASKVNGKTDNKKTTKLDVKKKTSDTSSFANDKKRTIDIKSNTALSEINILNIKKKDSSKTAAHKNISQNKNRTKKTESTASEANGSKNTVAKTAPFETAENIILLKRKMHKEIFQRCLERKLLTSLEVWEDHENETSVETD